MSFNTQPGQFGHLTFGRALRQAQRLTFRGVYGNQQRRNTKPGRSTVETRAGLFAQNEMSVLRIPASTILLLADIRRDRFESSFGDGECYKPIVQFEFQ
jgi:hypothetical protein